MGLGAALIAHYECKGKIWISSRIRFDPLILGLRIKFFLGPVSDQVTRKSGAAILRDNGGQRIDIAFI